MGRRRRAALLPVLSLVALLAACGEDPPPPAPENLAVTSPAFAAGQTIPVEFTCDGSQESPPLVWSGAPDGTAEYAILMTDPDAPGGVFVHWVLLHVEATLTAIDAGVGETVGVLGENSAGENAYAGPCPPEGDDPHQYRFTVYALSRVIQAGEGASYDDVTAQIEEAALADGTLEALYGR